MTAPYTWQTSTEMMDNHIPAEVLSPSDSFSAVESTQGGSFLVSVGTDGKLRASIAGGDKPGWSEVDMTGDFSSLQNYHGIVLCHAFATVDSHENGSGIKTYTTTALNIAVAVEFKTKKVCYQELYTLSGAPADPADWLNENLTRNWKAHPLPGGNPKFSPDQVGIEKLTTVPLATGTGGNAKLSAWIKNRETGTETLLFLDIGSGEWAEVSLDQDVESLVSVCAGDPGNGHGNGIYYLGRSSGDVYTLYFKAFDRAKADMQFNFDGLGTPKAISSFSTFPQQSVPPASSATNLLLATDQGLFLYPYGSHSGDKPFGIMTPSGDDDTGLYTSLVGDLADLQAVRKEDRVLLWGLNSPGPDGQVIYSSAAYEDLSVDNGWSVTKVFPMVTGVTAMAPSMEDPTGVVRLFAVSRDGSFGGSPGTPQMVHLRRGSATGRWTATHVTIPNTSDYVTLKTHTHTLLLQDGQSCPVPGQEVILTAHDDTDLIVNDVQMQMRNGQGRTVRTSPTGHLSIIEPVSSLGGTRLTVTVSGQTDNGVSGMPAAALDPTAQVHSKLTAKKTADTIGKAQYVRKTQEQGKTVYVKTGLFAPGNVDEVRKKLGIVRTYDPSIKHKPVSPPGIELGGLWDDLTAAVHWVVHSAEKIESLVVKYVEDEEKKIVHLIITIADRAVTLVLDTMESVVSGITAIFKALGAFFEEVYKWLAFIFDFTTFSKIHDILERAFKSLLDGLNGDVRSGNAGDVVARSVKTTAFSGLKSPVSSQWHSHQADVHHKSGAGHAVQTNSKIHWASHHMSRGQISNAGTPTLNDPGQTLPDSLDKLVTAGKGTHDKFTNIFQGAAGDAANLSPQHLNPGELFPKLLEGIEGGGLETLLSTLITDHLSGVIKSKPGTDLILHAGDIQIPVISKLIEDFTGEPPSLFHIYLWVQAILIAVVIDIEVGPDGDPVAVLNKADLSGKFKKAAGLLTAKEGQAGVPVAVELDEEGENAWGAVLGVFRIAQAVFVACAGISAYEKTFNPEPAGETDRFGESILVLSLASGLPAALHELIEAAESNSRQPGDGIDFETEWALTKLATVLGLFIAAAWLRSKNESDDTSLEVIKGLKEMLGLINGIGDLIETVEAHCQARTVATKGLAGMVEITALVQALLVKEKCETALAWSIGLRTVAMLVSAVFLVVDSFVPPSDSQA